MSPAEGLLAGVELGGTKCVCTLGTDPEDVRMQISLPTGGDPQTTLARIEEVLRNGIALHGPVAALGIASFGPLDLDVRSARFGSIRRTPKPGWSDTPLAAFFSRAFGVPIRIDTDVNGAALAEGRWGAAQGLDDFAYVTVGTGVGVGLVVNGQLSRGFAHPELGHIRVARAPGDSFPGICPFHGACVEGLASGAAISARAGRPAEEVPLDHPAWESATQALAQLLHTIVLGTAPRRILIGGGVLKDRPQLLARLRRGLEASIHGYLDLPALVGDLDRYVIAPGLGASAGPLGALALALDARIGAARA
ncbi:MAG TPA: ROK family protein [Steroidobacteraceae bacterium]|nr:ROK family protein [Steroidobacteraceae bacterium]